MRAINQTMELWLRPRDGESGAGSFVKQFILFGYYQAVSCLFPVFIFASLAFCSLIDTALPRYDLLLVICIGVQVAMVWARMETRDELLVITFFHLLGVVMEMHKVHHGSWSYPEEAWTKVLGVPLYAGFMYASVGSYICQAWRNLQLGTVAWPASLPATIAALLIYFNFITNAYLPDMRLWISLYLVVIFRKTHFTFVLNGRVYSIPALLSFVLIGFFIWLAENIATFFGAWKYAYQHAGWKMVTWHKITSWSLLVIVSIIIVGQLKLLKRRRAAS